MQRIQPVKALRTSPASVIMARIVTAVPHTACRPSTAFAHARIIISPRLVFRRAQGVEVASRWVSAVPLPIAMQGTRLSRIHPVIFPARLRLCRLMVVQRSLRHSRAVAALDQARVQWGSELIISATRPRSIEATMADEVAYTISSVVIHALVGSSRHLHRIIAARHALHLRARRSRLPARRKRITCMLKVLAKRFILPPPRARTRIGAITATLAIISMRASSRVPSRSMLPCQA